MRPSIYVLALVCACGAPGSNAESGDGSTDSGTTLPGGSEATTDDGEPSPAFEVSSPDGSIRLTFPAGALPPGVDPSMISIGEPAVDDVFEDGDLEDILNLYAFEPDGLELLEPATLTVQAPADDRGIYIHESETLDTVEILAFEWDEPIDDVSTGQTEIDHFSIVLRRSTSPFTTLHLRAPLTDAWLGMTTSTRLELHVNTAVTKTWRREDGTRFEMSITDDDWILRGSFAAPLTNTVLTPDYIPDAPARHQTRDDISARGTFRCADEGMGRMEYSTQADLPFQVREIGASALDVKMQLEFDRIEQEIACTRPQSDMLDDHLDSAGEAPGFVSDSIDILAFAAGKMVAAEPSPRVRGITHDRILPALDPEASDAMFGPDGLFACGEANEDYEVVCPAMADPIPADADVLVYAQQTAEPFDLSDASRRYQYATVVDSDGNPSNDWVPQGPFVNDFFQGADRWYVSEWTSAGWTLTVSQVDDAQAVTTVSSTARAVIADDHITLYVSADEMAIDEPPYRLTAYGDDGAFTPSDRGGDVSGDLPTSLATMYDILAVAE